MVAQVQPGGANPSGVKFTDTTAVPDVAESKGVPDDDGKESDSESPTSESSNPVSQGEEEEEETSDFSDVMKREHRRFYFCTEWIRRGATLPNSNFQNPGNPIQVEKRPKSQRSY